MYINTTDIILYAPQFIDMEIKLTSIKEQHVKKLRNRQTNITKPKKKRT